jgi:hypothetical protein
MFSRRLLVLLSVGFFSSAGIASAQSLTVGVIAGAVFASQLHPGDALDRLSGTSTLFTAQKPGFDVGGFATWAVTEHLAFQPEVLFVKKGVKLNSTDNVTEVTVSVNYVEVPLLLRIGRAAGRTRSGGFALLGPSVGIRGARKAEIESSLGGGRSLDISNVYKGTDVGLVFAGGVEIRHEIIEIRYTVGLTDIATSANPHVNAVKNRAFSLMVGHKF